MIDLMKVDYRLTLLPPSGSKIDITNLYQSCVHEEMEDQIAAKLTVNIKNVKREDGWIHQHVFLAKRLVVEATDGNGWKEIFRGSVWNWKTVSDDHTVQFIAYDPIYGITISKEHYYFTNGVTGAVSIREIAAEQGIPIGSIEGPNIPLTKKVYKNYIADTMAERLKESERKGSCKHILRSTKGKLDCIREGGNATIYELTDWTTESSSDEHSIENLVTVVKIYGNSKDDARPKVEAKQTGKTEFGNLQEVLYKSEFDNMAEAHKAAAAILAEKGKPEVNRPLIHPDIPWLRKGDKVMVNSGTINGMCIVKSVARDLTSRKMTLQLKG